MSADDCLNAGVHERIEDRVDLRTRYTKDVFYALCLESVNDNLSSGFSRISSDLPTWSCPLLLRFSLLEISRYILAEVDFEELFVLG
jgi:hypothetical protein